MAYAIRDWLLSAHRVWTGAIDPATLWGSDPALAGLRLLAIVNGRSRADLTWHPRRPGLDSSSRDQGDFDGFACEEECQRH